MPYQPNVNGIFYSKEELDNAIKSIMDHIEIRRMCVVSTIPNCPEINPMDVIAIVKRIYFNADEGCFMGEIKFIDTPISNALRSRYEESDENIYLLMNKTGMIENNVAKIINVISFTLSLERKIYDTY